MFCGGERQGELGVFGGDEKPARAGLRFVGLPVMLFGFSSFVVFTFSVWIDASGLKFWDYGLSGGGVRFWR